MNEQPAISYVIASRNDGWCGDSVGRLIKTLTNIFGRHDASDYEVIVIDWGSKHPLHKGFNIGACERFFYVPRELTGPDFHETRALNLGIRMARGKWIARLDQDTYPGRLFVQWFREVGQFAFSEPSAGFTVPTNPAYFSVRRDLPEDLVWRNWHRTGEPFWRGAVGILLATREAWYGVRGYYEGHDKRNHMEHDLALRFKRTCGLVDLGPVVEYDFHHQHHPSMPGRADNPLRHESVLLQMIDEGKLTNDENWGMKQYWDQIKEVTL